MRTVAGIRRIDVLLQLRRRWTKRFRDRYEIQTGEGLIQKLERLLEQLVCLFRGNPST